MRNSKEYTSIIVDLDDTEKLRKIGKLVEKNKARVLNYSDSGINYLVDKNVAV